MANFRIVEPKHYTVNTVGNLRIDKPWSWFDLDGTLTRPEGKLLAAIFIEKNPEFGTETARTKLTNLFSAFRAGEIQYDPYLVKTQAGFAEVLKSTGKTEAEVRQVSDNFFRTDGYNEVLPHARPMVNELRRIRCNTGMITGAPQVVADPFAAYIGIEHVFAMPAETDSSGRFTSDAFEELNTGLLTSKGEICDEISSRCATLFGAGNTQSDTCVMETAYLLGEKNPIDMKGFAFLMNTGQIGDPIVERFMKSAGHRHAQFGFFCIPKRPKLNEFINFFRSMLRGTLIKNGYEHVVHEIEGVRPLTAAEKEELARKREEDPDCWSLCG